MPPETRLRSTRAPSIRLSFRDSRRGEALRSEQQLPSVRAFPFTRDISACKRLPLGPGEGRSRNHSRLLPADKAPTSICTPAFSLSAMLVLAAFRHRLPHPATIFLPLLAEEGIKVLAWPFQGVLGLPGLPVSRVCTVIKLLLVFLSLTCLFLGGVLSHRTQKVEGNHFSSPALPSERVSLTHLLVVALQPLRSV